MTARNLPTGFTEGMWEGWEAGPGNFDRARNLADGRGVYVVFNRRGFHAYSLSNPLTKSGSLTEQAALDWAEKYAAENGGWLND